LRKAVFLDRDGTINVDPGYLSHPGQMELIPEVGSGLAKLQAGGFTLVIVTNQSGVGRGLVKEPMLKPIHARMNELLAGYGVHIDAIYYCTHHPEDDCSCRKPKPELVLEAQRDLDIDLKKSFVVGDKASDIELGRATGVKASVLVLTGDGAEQKKLLKPGRADHIAENLSEAADWILKQKP
jgi:histidinol-phosphate phosphatase family protein